MVTVHNTTDAQSKNGLELCDFSCKSSQAGQRDVAALW